MQFSILLLLGAVSGVLSSPTPEPDALQDRAAPCKIGATYRVKWWENALRRYRTEFRSIGTKTENFCHYFYEAGKGSGALVNIQCFKDEFKSGKVRYLVDWSINASPGEWQDYKAVRTKALDKWQLAIQTHEHKKCVIEKPWKADRSDAGEKKKHTRLPGIKDPYAK